MEKENTHDPLSDYRLAPQPDMRQRAQSWQTAIGLQEVDGLKVSSYLVDTARAHIEGRYDLDTASKLLHSYYERREARHQAERQEEADKATVNIVRLLATPSFTFSAEGLCGIHRAIFQGVLPHAGQLRDYDFTKAEWVLDGASVVYAPYTELSRTIQYDLDRERAFSYSSLSEEEKIQHLARFFADLWQIHPFREGNTRATSVFIIKYLRSIGYAADNDPFRQNSWYLRNALARASYRNVARSIDPDTGYLVAFLRCLLLGEEHTLRSRDMKVEG